MCNLSKNHIKLFEWYEEKLRKGNAKNLLDIVKMLKNDREKLIGIIRSKMEYITEIASNDMNENIAFNPESTPIFLVEYLEEKLLK